MARFEHTLFVCTHEREPGSGKASCGGQGSHELLERLRALVKANKLKGRVRVTSSGCLDLCSKGCALVAYRAPQSAEAPSGSEETWYTHLTPQQAEELFAAQVLANQQLICHVEPTRSLTSTPRDPLANSTL
jgi:(2Fe-2S) ferredoxin